MRYNKYDRLGAIHHEWYNEKILWYKEVVDLCVNRAIGKTAIDLGCGDGVVGKLLSENGFEVYGVDYETTGLQLSNKLSPDVTTIRADLNNFTTDKYFDYMVCLNTIEHLENPKNIVNIFKKNIEKRCLIITDRVDKSQAVSDNHFKEYDIEELKNLFSGFKSKEIKLKTQIMIALEVSKI